MVSVASLVYRLADRISVSIQVMSCTLIRLLAVETSDAPEVGRNDKEGGHPGHEERTKSGVRDDMVLAQGITSSCGTASIRIAPVVHVNVQTSSIYDEHNGCCDKPGDKQPEEQASKLRPAGQTSKEADEGGGSEDDTGHQEPPQRMHVALLDEREDNQQCREKPEYNRTQNDPRSKSSVCWLIIHSLCSRIQVTVHCSRTCSVARRIGACSW